MDIENLVPDETPKIKITIKKGYVPTTQRQHDDRPKLVKSEIISASRRTDIPAFYMDLMMDSLKKGMIEVVSPYNVKSLVSLTPGDVKIFSWWSKDYNRWLSEYQAHPDLFHPFGHMFNFTLNGQPDLEMGVRSTLEQRLTQLEQLVQLFGPQAIKLRFDPITVWTETHRISDSKTMEVRRDNLEHFPTIVERASQLGIRQIIFAFCLSYPKVVKRMARVGKTLQSLTIEQQKEILTPMIEITKTHGIQLQTCCGSQLIGYQGIGQSKCVDGPLIEQIYGIHLKTIRKDRGQRDECQCSVSRDIGSYHMSCRHGCDYCYGNPTK